MVETAEKKIEYAIKFFKKGEFNQALSHFKTLEKEYENFIVHWYLGHIYFRLHRYFAAIKHIKRSIKLKSEDTLNLNFLGEIYLEINNYDDAIALFNKVLKLDNNNKTAILNLARAKLDCGDTKQSEKYYNQLLEKNRLNFKYIYSLIRINKNYLNTKVIKQIQNSNKELDYDNQIYSKLILAKQAQIDKDYTKEIDHLINAHKMFFLKKQKSAKQQINYYQNLLPKIISELKKKKFSSIDSINPIFIMGLPRSGTTLIEKTIISGDNEAQSLGESDVFDKVFFSAKVIDNYEDIHLITKFKFEKEKINSLIQKVLEQYYEQGLKKNNLLFTDKSISNFLYIDFIYKIFPNAKFVYCYRNPIANIIGIFRSFLPNVLWSHSLQKIFDISDLYYKKLEKIRNDKLINIHVVELEKFTANPEDGSKDLYNFLGLKWTSDCIKKTSKKIIIKSTSNLQVREEIQKHEFDYTTNYLKILNNLGFSYKWLR